MENSSRDVRPSLMGRMRGSSSVAARFPLPVDFFAQIESSSEQNRRYEEQADKLRTDAVRNVKWSMSYEDGSSGWKLSSSKKHFRDTGIRTYCRKYDTSRNVEFKCMGKVAMTLSRTMDALYADNTLDFRSNSTFLMENCLDAAVLHVISKRDEIEPHNYVGINWIAARGSGLFAKSRDVCFLRSTGTMMDNEGNDIGYLVLHSIDLKQCPSMESSYGLVRTKVSGVFLFKENMDGRSTNVMWQGSSSSWSASSTGKLVAFVHETFTSFVTNLNKFMETKFMAHQMESKRSQLLAKGARKYCYMCNKRFTLIRPRYSCGICSEDVCKDCGNSSRVKSFDSERFSTVSARSSKGEGATHFCKRCVHSARKELQNQPAGTPSFFSTTTNIFLDFEHSEATEEDSCERLSAISSNDSVRSLQKILSERSMKTLTTEKSCEKAAPQSMPEFSGNFSTSQVPFSPLSIRAHREKGRARLETDPSESYDVYDFEDDDVEDAEDPETIEMNNNTPFVDRRSSYENRDRDLATRLREISAKAQELLDVTRRNSCLMSDTSSAPRTSELLAFQQLDQSIAEQADLLNVIGFVSTGRVYMENNGPEGVRISESSSLSDSDRFEEVLA